MLAGNDSLRRLERSVRERPRTYFNTGTALSICDCLLEAASIGWKEAHDAWET